MRNEAWFCLTICPCEAWDLDGLGVHELLASAQNLRIHVACGDHLPVEQLFLIYCERSVMMVMRIVGSHLISVDNVSSIFCLSQ